MEIKMRRVWLAAVAALAVMPKGEASFLFGLPTWSATECKRYGYRVVYNSARGMSPSLFCSMRGDGEVIAWVYN